MGLTTLKMEVANRGRPENRGAEIPDQFRAIYSDAPATILRRLEIRPVATEGFSLASGSHIQRRKGRGDVQIWGKSRWRDVFAETLLAICQLDKLSRYEAVRDKLDQTDWDLEERRE